MREEERVVSVFFFFFLFNISIPADGLSNTHLKGWFPTVALSYIWKARPVPGALKPEAPEEYLAHS